MKIIVADDEFFARKAIVKMLGELLPDVEICLEAETGQEILDYLKDNTADVVFTDIRMPEKDGLEVAEYVQRYCGRTSVVIISGFADFSYASAAIRFGVEDYLVKPVQKEKLKETIERLRSRKHTRERIVEEAVESRLEKEGIRYMNPEEAFSEEKAAKLLTQSIPESGIGTDCAWRMAVIQPGKRQQNWSWKRIMEQREYFRNHLERMRLWEYYFYPCEEFVLLASAAPQEEREKTEASEAGEPILEEYLPCSLKKMLRALERDRDVVFAAGLSRVFRGLEPGTLLEAYRECETAMSRRYQDSGQYVFEKEQENTDSQDAIVRRIVRYVEENYRDDITLAELANEKLFMNASYLSRVFKAGTGMTFSRYLIRCRMEKARQLLGRPEMKIGDVAQYVGYNDTSYFIQTFKKYYHQTPEQFRANECRDK